MGCCFSQPSGPNAPYPGGAPSGSAHAINSPALHPTPDTSAPASRAVSRLQQQRSTSATGATAATPTSQSRRHSQSHTHTHQHRPRAPLSQHIDKPLRLHQWTSRSRKWKPSLLAKERSDFFDTRVTGRAEAWQTLRAALEVLWEADAARRHGTAGDGGLQDDGTMEAGDEATALATAQSIIHAAEMTLPTGDLADGAYDSLGNYYPLPEWIVSDPINLESTADEPESKQETGEPAAASSEEVGESPDEDELARRREEKGKGVLDVKQMVKLRARLSEGNQDIVINVGTSETVRNISRRVAEDASLPATKRIRLAYMGKMLQESKSLQEQGWKPGHVVNALVFNR